MRSIPLTQGRVALVDDADYDALAKHKWHAARRNDRWYAARDRREVSRGLILMHREIMGAPPGVLVDHANRDGLDNCRANLRLTDKVGNARNMRKRITPTSSRFKGVCWYGALQKWHAYITVDRRRQHIGYFVREEDAAQAYAESAVRLFGEFARVG